MKIETRFGIDDKIYPITLCKDEWFCPGYFIVTEIRILSDKILYMTEYSNGIDEKFCFCNQAEAQKECERRNGKV